MIYDRSYISSPLATPAVSRPSPTGAEAAPFLRRLCSAFRGYVGELGEGVRRIFAAEVQVSTGNVLCFDHSEPELHERAEDCGRALFGICADCDARRLLDRYAHCATCGGKAVEVVR